MSIDSKIERVNVNIDSKDRTSGTNENFIITLSPKLTRVVACDVVSVEVPFSYYTVNTSNNVLKFTNAVPTTFTATVTPGNYDGITFAGQLQTLMNAQMAGFTVTYNVASYTLTFANASQFNILLSGSTIAPVIGISADSGLTTSYTTQIALNLSGPNFLMILSSRIVNLKKYKPYFHSGTSTCLYKLQINDGPGTIICDKNVFPNSVNFGVRNDIDQIDLNLVDPDGNTVDLNGQRWSITLVFYIE